MQNKSRFDIGLIGQTYNSLNQLLEQRGDDITPRDLAEIMAAMLHEYLKHNGERPETFAGRRALPGGKGKYVPGDRPG